MVELGLHIACEGTALLSFTGCYGNIIKIPIQEPFTQRSYTAYLFLGGQRGALYSGGHQRLHQAVMLSAKGHCTQNSVSTHIQ